MELRDLESQKVASRKTDAKKKSKPEKVSLRELFSYSTKRDAILMLFGVVGAIAHGGRKDDTYKY